MSLPARLFQAAKDYIGSRGGEESALTTLNIGYKAASPPMRFSGFGGASGDGGWGNSLFPHLDILSNLYANTKVDYRQAVGDLLQSSLLLTPIKWLSRVLPEAPIYLSRLDNEGKEVEKLYRHDSINLLNRPNPFYGGKLLWAGFAASWNMAGRVYLRKIRSSVSGANGRTKVVQLWYVPHFRIRPIYPWDGSEFITHYEETVNGYITKIPVEDIIHFRDGIDPRNEREGLSSADTLLREIYGDNEAANVMAAMFRNMGMGGLLVSSDHPDYTIEATQAVALQDALERKTTSDNRFRPVVLSGPAKAERLNFSPKELDVSGSRRFQEERMASLMPGNGYVFGYGAHLQHSIYNNVSESRKDAYESSLIPLQSYIEDELDFQLLPDFVDKAELDNLTFEHDYSKVRALQENEDALYRRVVQAYANGVFDRWTAKTKLGEVPEESDKGVYAKAAMPVMVGADTPSPAGKTSTKADEVASDSELKEGRDWWLDSNDLPEQAKALIDAKVEGVKVNGHLPS